MDNIISIIKDQVPNKLATHNCSAYVLSQGSDQVPTHSCRDDGEVNAGGVLLRLLQSNKLTNVVIVATRWYGGTHIGGARFKCMEQCAKEALQVMGALSVTAPLPVTTPISGGQPVTLNKAALPPRDVANDSDVNNNQPRVAHDSSRVKKVDNLVLHDSTGKNLDANKLFGQHNVHSTVKHWAPYYDLASKALEMFSVQKTITLVTGVRHLKQMVNHSLSPSSFRIKATHFVETALARNPSVKVVICSLNTGF